MPIGVVGRAHGLAGEVRVALYNPESEALSEAEAVHLEARDGSRSERRVLRAHPHGRGMLLALEGVSSRREAEALRGATLLLPRGALPTPDEDEYYDLDLVGLTARSPDGVALGRVVAVEHLPASDAVTLALDDGTFVDVPFREPFVRAVDLEAGLLELEIPEGLPARTRP